MGRFSDLQNKGMDKLTLYLNNTNINVAQVFTRVFINNDSAEAYLHHFRAWFRILHDEFGILDRWRHMDGEEHDRWQVAVMDQDSKQLAGM
jgi:hypothetical protein